MSATPDQSAQVCTLPFSDELTIYTAAQAKDQLLAELARCKEIEIDLAQVAELDTAGLQVLLLAKREASRLGKTLRLVAHSPAVVEVLEQYHLAAYFGDPLVIPGKSLKPAQEVPV